MNLALTLSKVNVVSPALARVSSLSEIRVLKVTLASGNFAFTALKIYDHSGVEKYAFGAGDEVLFNGKVMNNGPIASLATIYAYDVDTNARVAWWPFLYVIEPGVEVAISALGNVVLIDDTRVPGGMPNRDWNLRFELTP